MSQALIRRGRAHVFGDNVSLDDDIMPARFAAQRVTDSAALIPHLFENIDPGFAARVQPGDIILAGRNFACGKPRLQGFIAMSALNLSIVAVSMPYKILRRAVARALPVITGAEEVHGYAATGDEIEIDFSVGELRNLTQNTVTAIPPIPPILREVAACGGAEGALRDWLAKHPEQAA